MILDPVICPICGRSIPESQKDAHHLIPKSKGGKSFEYIHRICHKQIHALFKENELAKVLNTAESLRNHSDMQTFINWVKNKPDDFYERAAKSSRIKKQ
ncbi:HNH endonuclease [Candidatus Methylopumilus planktonicus]|nr:HNH endonuclease [Candidatus Methylopumilus planktonicus]QDD24004.1 HNH endonuclease [Candidatus Methylopumilus planktonicus]